MVTSNVNHTIEARITAAPEIGAPVFVDFMEQPLHIRIEDPIKLGSPDMAFDANGMPLEGSRTVTIPVHVQGAGASLAMRDVARAVSTPNRWLMLKLQADAEPVWYRVWPESPGTMDLSNVYRQHEAWWTWELKLTVDSTAVGVARAIPQYGTDNAFSTITNTGNDRGVVIDAPGEAPAPLRIDVRPDQSINGRRVMVSTFSVPWGSPLLDGDTPAIIKEDNEFNAVSGHSTRTTGASYLSGGSGLTVSLDTTSTRQVTNSGLAGWRPEPGRYLVMARMYRQGSNGQADIRMGQRWGGQTSWQNWVQYRPAPPADDGGWRSSWLPLGYLQHPLGDTGEGIDPSKIMPPTIAVQAKPTSLSANSKLHFDQFAFVPVSLARGAGERACFAGFERGIGYGGVFSVRFDSENRRVSVVDTGGNHHAVPQPLRTGGWPVAVPGMATCVSVFLDTSEAPLDDESQNITSELHIRTAPRMLHLGQE